jgi:DNA (cytosine-5)-methyltransferase 1
MKVIGLFSGIGGIEEGFRRAGLVTELLCELEPAARRVLKKRFPELCIEPDVRELASLPDAEILAAGFPCQDLSQAGRTVGITGPHSGLVDQVFRLVATCRKPPEWLVLENVPFMLHLARGRAMQVVTSTLEEHGYRWAYRIVDTMAFGIPQRRKRVIILGARESDPRAALFCDEAGEHIQKCRAGSPRGFYWTEGRSGLGWALNAVPPLKGGSGVGIPSSPAIWFPERRLIGTLDIRDAERLQGLRAGWTEAGAKDHRSERMRWRLVGNAMSVPVAGWLGRRLLQPGAYDAAQDPKLDAVGVWPAAAWGSKGRRYAANVSSWPLPTASHGLGSFLRYPIVPLSARASAGFYNRALTSTLRFEDGFLDDVAFHLNEMRRQAAVLTEARLAA